MIDIALKYHNAGLSVVPVGRDKRPALSDDAENGYTWTPHQHNLIKPNGIFDKAKRIGLVCGKVSGTEVIDIDNFIIFVPLFVMKNIKKSLIQLHCLSQLPVANGQPL